MRKKAIFCPIKDEQPFIDLWLKYYSQYFDKKDIYILDFGSEKKYLEQLKNRCQIIKTKKNILDVTELYKTILETHTQLLQKYEYVIPLDVDEILYHEKGLGKFIDELDQDFVRARGYEVIHLPKKEKKIDFKKKILKQRKYWFRNKLYDKTIITKKTLTWTYGLHNAEEVPNYSHLNPKLILIHLHRLDYEQCLKRHKEYANKKWSEDTIKNNYSFHYRLNEEEFKEWYYKEQKIEKIPLKIRKNVPL